MAFAENLIAVRRAHGLTQKMLASKLFVTRQAVSRWERGEVTPGIDMMKLIAAVTGEPLSHLLEMPEHYCESCGMYLTPDDCGTDARGKKTDHYCKWCYEQGKYTYETTMVLLGVLLGRFICGFLCPFGWLQELLHKIPSPKLSTRRLKPLRYIKYAVLLIMVVLLPAVIVNTSGMGDPFFCKYLCPQGVLEGAIPLSLTNAGIRAALGKLFSWKFCILLAVVVGSVVFYRPFCKWLCPLGAVYALMNHVSLFQMRVDRDTCVSCGACAKACPMDVDITKTPNHAECIRCGKCIKSCPTKAICYQYGFGDKSKTEIKEN